MGLFDKANIGSTLGAAGSIGGSIISGVSSLIAAKSNRDWQERQAAIERQWQGMPAQVMRARQAGLNPNLVFGKGTGITNVPSTPSAPNMPQVPDFGVSLAEIGKSYDEREMNRPVKEAEAIERTSNARNKDEDTHRQAIENITLNQRLYQTLKALEEEAKAKEQDALAAGYRAEKERIAKEILEGQSEELKQQPAVQNETTRKQGEMYVKQGNSAVVSADAQQKSAKAAFLSASANMVAARAQDYLAHNPQGIEKWFVDTINNLGLSPNDMPKVIDEIKDKLDKLSPGSIARSTWKRIKSKLWPNPATRVRHGNGYGGYR